jgi:hypothetical protein
LTVENTPKDCFWQKILCRDLLTKQTHMPTIP